MLLIIQTIEVILQLVVDSNLMAQLGGQFKQLTVPTSKPSTLKTPITLQYLQQQKQYQSQHLLQMGGLMEQW